ncbi:MAG TPA: hypothetical protein VMR79_03740, partial [Verrucomicrobiae bacterium]|nr:hypothetical protein [Verrucomicrobiae bacterium]
AIGLPAATPAVRRRLVLGTGAAAILAALSAVPYLLARREAALGTATAAVQRLYSAMPGRTGATPALVVALATLRWWRAGIPRPGGGRCIAMLAACGVLAHLLALGPAIAVGGVTVPGPFAALAALAPGVAVMRAPGRFNAVTTMALAALAGVGVAGVLRRTGTRPTRALVEFAAAAFAAGAVAYGLPHPVPVRPIEKWSTLPPAYRWLARAPRGPLVEIPFHDVRQPFAADEEARRMYRSIWHWQPLLNGYSGFVPLGYGAVSTAARALPAPAARATLVREAGLAWVLVHRDALGLRERRAWRPPRPGLRVAAVFGPDVIFAVTSRAD